ncbi:MAG TPA: tetratricopeptide repeat protein [Pirellulales bacterium]|nr:tetratricopeptide repeat protein [Pirellulales bacterium]
MKTHYIAAACLMLALRSLGTQAQDAAGDLEGRFAKALADKKLDEAIRLATKAIAAEPDQPAPYALRATAYIAAGKSREAIGDLDRLLAINPNQTRLLEVRGTEKFKLGQFKEAIADFDLECKLDPARSPWHWKRGLAYYYAGQYDKGRDQFQAYHDREDNDVENAVWRVMCMARMKDVGLKKAQDEILVVRRDSRVPMMEAYALFAGKATPADVLAAIKRGTPDNGELHRRTFYGNLYLGLYHDMKGERDRAAEHLKVAVKHPIEHFMWDIAKLHLAVLTVDGK